MNPYEIRCERCEAARAPESDCPDCAAARRVMAALIDASPAFAAPDPPSGYWSRFSMELSEKLDAERTAASGRARNAGSEVTARVADPEVLAKIPGSEVAAKIVRPEVASGTADGPRTARSVLGRGRLPRWGPIAAVAAAAGLVGWLVLVGRGGNGALHVRGGLVGKADPGWTSGESMEGWGGRSDRNAAPPAAGSLATQSDDDATRADHAPLDTPSEKVLLQKLQDAPPATLEAWRASLMLSSVGRGDEDNISGESALEGERHIEGSALSDEAHLLQSAFPDEMLGADGAMSPYELYDRMQPNERQHVLEVMRGDMG